MKTKSNTLVGTLSVLFTVIILISCSDKKNLEYGFINEFNQHRISIVEVDEYRNFNDLVNRIEELSCQDSIPAFKIKTKYVEKLVALHNPCWEEFGCILIKRRNKLKIKNDSIKINRTITLDSIETYIKKHYINEFNSYSFSENPRKAMISIEYENHEMKNLEITIDKITDAYSKLKLKIPLVIMLERPIPPAPPNFVN